MAGIDIDTNNIDTNNIDKLIKQYKLFWQYPVITEKAFHDQNITNENYLGLPWATIIDKRYKAELIFKIFAPHIDKTKSYYTCCQHISFRKLQHLFNALNISTVYTPHKKLGETTLQTVGKPDILLKACPLYAVNIEDPARNSVYQGCREDLIGKSRKWLYSFVGGYQPTNYLTDVRGRIFRGVHDSGASGGDVYIKNTGAWFFNNVVYNKRQNVVGELNEGADKAGEVNEYMSVMADSRWALCPGGSGPSSIRFWEALAMGAIPVLLSDTMDLPEHKLWGDAIVRVPEADVGGVREVLESISAVREQEMRENCVKIYEDLRGNYRDSKQYNMVVFSNCHGERYIEIFKRDTTIAELFNIEYIVSYSQLNNFSNFKQQFKDADILLINNIKKYDDFTIKNLKKILKKDCLLIVIPFVRFEGYWIPEPIKRLKYIKDNAVSFFPDIKINDINKYLTESTYNKESFINYYNTCLNKLKHIENESDIKFYDFFIENHTKYPFFRDNYHPTTNMLEYVASEILTKINNHYPINYCSKQLQLCRKTNEYGHYKPIKDCIKNYLDIDYDLDEIFICSRKEYLQKILKYESTPNAQIIDLTDMKQKLKLYKEFM
jgi:hypothetical protein